MQDNAIRTALSIRFSGSVIDHHFHILKMGDVKPIIRFKKPNTRPIRDEKTRLKLKEYVNLQKQAGFKEKDIKEMLLHYGYDKKSVDEM